MRNDLMKGFKIVIASDVIFPTTDSKLFFREFQ